MARGKNKPSTLATFRDGAGRTHRVVLMADRLVLDLIGSDPPRVVALLRHDEGIEEARSVLFGREGEEGYVERAKREQAPLCRRLEPADLRPPASSEPGPAERPDDDGRVAA